MRIIYIYIYNHFQNEDNKAKEWSQKQDRDDEEYHDLPLELASIGLKTKRAPRRKSLREIHINTKENVMSQNYGRTRRFSQ